MKNTQFTPIARAIRSVIGPGIKMHSDPRKNGRRYKCYVNVSDVRITDPEYCDTAEDQLRMNLASVISLNCDLDGLFGQVIVDPTLNQKRLRVRVYIRIK